MDDKVFFEEMKSFFGVDSLEDAAEKLGYSRNTAATWRSKGTTETVRLKFAKLTNKVEKPYKSTYLRYFSSVEASAGYGANNDDENYELIEVSSDFLENVLKIPSGCYDMINVVGDSMEPFASSGDKVIVDRKTEAKNGDIIIANILGDIFIKKLLRDPIKKTIKLTSLNNFYQDITLTSDVLEHLKIIGRVRCKIQFFQ